MKSILRAVMPYLMPLGLFQGNANIFKGLVGLYQLCSLFKSDPVILVSGGGR